MDLKAAQEEMRRRWLRLDGEPGGGKRRKPRKRGVRPLSAREAQKAERAKESAEIAILATRPNLLCPSCHENHTTLNMKTGELKLCKKCNQRRILLVRYGMTLREFQTLFEEQGGECAICGEHMDDPHVDHTFGHVRGLLCPLCNTGLGFFKDNPDLMEKAAKYVMRNKFAREIHKRDRCRAPWGRNL